jgi:regulatory subunit for Cdc7p protein kinase
MAAVAPRRTFPRQHSHLTTVPSPQQVSISRSVSVSSNLKRPRSPDYLQDPASLKRQKAATVSRSPAPSVSQQTVTTTAKDEEAELRREQRRIDREQFRIKYTKAFPSWSFYFDSDVAEHEPGLKEALEERIEALGGVRGFSFESPQ